jgi:serine/threonine-protein kinase HipA
MENNALDIDLAISVGDYFRLGKGEMNNIIDEVKSGVSGWQKIANEINIPRSEQTMMATAFRVK